MKVRDCSKCKFFEQRYWNQKYKPVNYHMVGISHVYGFCSKHKQRVLKIKKCMYKELIPNDTGTN